MGLLSALPKPLLDDIVRNRSIPIVGAGFSLNAKLPSGKKVPDWKELAKGLLPELEGYPDVTSPIDVIVRV